MKNCFLLFLCIFFSAKLFATAQVPDFLIVDKDTIKLHSNPLEEYFKIHPLPDNLITMTSSANWRGYIAYFKFEGNKLVVENIYKENYQENNQGTSDYSLISIYKDVFGDTKNFACDFYTGLLICPYGKQLQYVHMGYSSVYEYYRLFEIKSGNKIKTKDFLGDEFYQFKRDYYSYFKTTDAYKEKANQFRQTMKEMDSDLSRSFSGNETKKKSKKENKYLKQKEAELNAEKELDSFMFLFVDDYIKTIEIPNKQ